MDWTTPQAVTGLRAPSIVQHVAPVTQTAAVGHGPAGMLDPGNPLLWAAGFVALTLGLVGVSGSVRLGKAKASASVGSS